MRIKQRRIFQLVKSLGIRMKSESNLSQYEQLPVPLRLFNSEQLQKHARELAGRHETGMRIRKDRLLQRLAENEIILLQNNEYILSSLKAGMALTLAGEWLLDNSHKIEEQIRIAKTHLPKKYSLELPSLTNGQSIGFPRVYDIALEIIAHVDGRIDLENITGFISAYQSRTSLTLGELWAIPIMLRLALIENIRRVSVRVSSGMRDRSSASVWVSKLIKCSESDPKNIFLIAADLARSKPEISTAFVAEFAQGMIGQGSALEIPMNWIGMQLAESGLDVQQAIQNEGKQQAADQVSVGSSIASLRALESIDWNHFVEHMSAVEYQLRLDPANVYSAMDFATRDRYRRKIEELAKVLRSTEQLVAEKLIHFARQENTPLHIGYYLFDDKFLKFKQSLGLPKRMLWFASNRMQITTVLYFGFIALLSLLGAKLATDFLFPGPKNLVSLCSILLIFLCFTQVAFAFVNWLTPVFVKPKLLSKIDYSQSIASESQALVVIPCLLTTRERLDQLLNHLEIHYLANHDPFIRFGLLTDFTDSNNEIEDFDAAILNYAKEAIGALNQKYQGSLSEVFFLFHRPRLWNLSENCWMGYERKRGKLSALNSILRLASHPHAIGKFAHVSKGLESLQGTRYVITLDSDTQLPRDSARKLIGTMAHPLNRPFYDERLKRITRGYSILQPRIVMSLPGSRRSLFSRIYAGEVGIDPYTRAVSDIYQDLFDEGSFVGKGIYEVDSFEKVLDNALPENLILSHDLLEGAYARCGLVSDVILYEEQTANYWEDVSRRHRWVRGDWQIIQWLLPSIQGFLNEHVPNPISTLSKFKIMDNLRRSLLPASTLFLLLISWLFTIDPVSSLQLTEVVFLLVFLPPVLTALANVTRNPSKISSRMYLVLASKQLFKQLTQAIIYLIFLPQDAWNNLDAISRSLVRMIFTKKRLLEWKSTSDPKNTNVVCLSFFYRKMYYSLLVGLGVALGLLFSPLSKSHTVMAMVLAWIFAPALAYWMSRTCNRDDGQLIGEQTLYLEDLARKIWRFFEVYVSAEDSWLPPDNFQEYPLEVIAHRTSPTNIGMAFLANLSAYDFGFISLSLLLTRLTKSFESLQKLERYRGHFYNWYDTQTLKPLMPRYISSVDSGNLAGALITLKSALAEFRSAPIVSDSMMKGLRITFGRWLFEAENANIEHIKKNSALKSRLTAMREFLESPYQDCKSILDLRRGQGNYRTLILKYPTLSDEDIEKSESAWWEAKLHRECVDHWFEAVRWMQPILDLPDTPKSLLLDPYFPSVRTQLNMIVNFFACPDGLPTYRDAANFEQSFTITLQELFCEFEAHPLEFAWLSQFQEAIVKVSYDAKGILSQIEELISICSDCSVFDYDFLYDESRRLLSIGYNVSEHRLDNSYYDLLASEARLCSFVAIAQDLLPQEHWFALGRSLTAWRYHPVLLSWSGSMFEYLMPLLIMPTSKNTLLGQTYQTVIDRQIAYGKERGVPWGMSECGYNSTDVNLNYQYRAFGVPGLGFKRGLEDDLVIAPYASMMALMVDPLQAYSNLREMRRIGFEGKYGFFEAVDYTSRRLAPGQSYAIVRSFMAHHQGMSLLALSSVLHDKIMVKRFTTDARVKATELLLHERIPNAKAFHPLKTDSSNVVPTGVERDTVVRVITTPHTNVPEVHLLSNGRYHLMITNAGGGYSRWKDVSLTRWKEDAIADDWGSFCYVRDLTNKDICSSSFQPTLVESSEYEVIFSQAKAEFKRKYNNLEIHTEITVSPEDDVELRRFSVTNLSKERRLIELTSFAEVVLARSASDDGHPAFSKLFIETKILTDKNAIICTRRPRSDQEKHPLMFHLMSVQDDVANSLSFETDRKRFIGRGRDSSNPIVMEYGFDDECVSKDLSGESGSVLDPIVAIRCRLEIGPEQTVRIHVVTGASQTEGEALRLIEEYQDRHLANRVFELAWIHRQLVLRQWNVSEADSRLYNRLASSIVYASTLHRAPLSIISKNRRGQSDLWGSGISGDLPIVLLRMADIRKIALVEQLVRAHSYWRHMGLAIELVIWNEDKSGYLQHLNERILDMIALSQASQWLDKPGGIFLRRPDHMTEDECTLFQTVARVVIVDDRGTFKEQVERRERSSRLLPSLVPNRSPFIEDLQIHSGVMSRSDLLFSNSFGGFSSDGLEYVISSDKSHQTPAPWVNVIANPYFGTVVSESGSAYTWCENAHEFRLTPWCNDGISDRGGEAFYLRDENTGQFWSPMPFPASSTSLYETRHGFGYSEFRNRSHGIESEVIVSVAIDAPVKITQIKIINRSTSVRKLSVTGYCEWVLGELRAKSVMHLVSECDSNSGTLLLSNPYHAEFGRRIGFFDLSESSRSFTCDREEFLGRNGRLKNPDAMHRRSLSGRSGAGLDACSALQTQFVLRPGESKQMVFVLGVGRDSDDVRNLTQRFCHNTLSNHALQEVKSYWDKTLSTIRIKTPDLALDLLTNGWLIYQLLSSRLWARSGFYQSGGAFGFRDQLQDAMALLHCEPQLLRDHLLRCAARQFIDGDVQHWWHPSSGRGVRSHCSDDYLWLPLATARYVLSLADTGILDVKVHYIEGRQVKPDEEGYLDLPQISDESATLYEHCVRAIQHSLRFGSHGLPLIGSCDWNDGMNLVGEHGKGESVWLAFFLIHVLEEFSRIADIKKDQKFSLFCLSEASRLKGIIEANGWDGDWYLRAFFDSGEAVGSARNLENKIDSLPQSWSVLADIGNLSRQESAMSSVIKHLIDKDHSLIKIFQPPFDKSSPNPGYIRGYVPGIRENGGQYTHAAIWTVMAIAKLGKVDMAWDLLSMLNPINLANTSDKARVYQVEPYVMAADVYASPAHLGHGGWTWYTGAAAWMYRLVTESLIGLKLEGDRLSITPRLPKQWEEFAIDYRFRETNYHIVVRVGDGEESVLRVNGKIEEGVILVLVDDRLQREVILTIPRSS